MSNYCFNLGNKKDTQGLKTLWHYLRSLRAYVNFLPWIFFCNNKSKKHLWVYVQKKEQANMNSMFYG